VRNAFLKRGLGGLVCEGLSEVKAGGKRWVFVLNSSSELGCKRLWTCSASTAGHRTRGHKIRMIGTDRSFWVSMLEPAVQDSTSRRTPSNIFR
jgi:hypothetical protein